MKTLNFFENDNQFALTTNEMIQVKGGDSPQWVSEDPFKKEEDKKKDKKKD